MPMLQDLDLSDNYQISGTLPEAWGNATGPGAGLQSFKHFSIRSCNLTGTLPTSWATGLSGLATLDLAYNYITGMCQPGLQGFTIKRCAMVLSASCIVGELPLWHAAAVSSQGLPQPACPGPCQYVRWLVMLLSAWP